jgi:hypothetical protein
MNAPVSLVESFLIPQSQSPCADCTMIFTKRGSFSPVRYLADEVAGSKNVRKNFNIQIDVERMQPSDKVFEWCLDFPQTSEASQPFTDVSADGWLIPSSSVLSGSFLLRSEGDRSQSFPFSIQRPDVIEAILKQSPEDHPLLMCGFSCPIPARLSVFELLWTVDGEDEILAKISVSRASA